MNEEKIYKEFESMDEIMLYNKFCQFFSTKNVLDEVDELIEELLD